MAEVALTTVDNPYDPFTQFDDWYAFDRLQGYNTCDYLARITYTSDALSPEQNEEEIERAIDEAIKFNLIGVYKKVTRNESKEQDEIET